ncbi:MAG: bifunctional nuclease family protein [Phycisphaerae bacterium]|nr:bifunctional nuclease family protein [Phycisphaerae bacterium]
MPVQMELSRILIRETNDYQIIELRELNGERTFPIVIGLPEAQAIERRLRGIEIKRPQTHELLANLIQAFGGELQSITIHNLEDHTFFASLDIKKADGTLMNVDSRPSDAIALGIAKSVPIYVAEHVLEGAQSEA